MPEMPFYPEVLDSLKQYFDELYLVGGAVRNRFLSLGVTDVDLAAPYREEEVRARLAGSPFKVSTTSKKLGTLKISASAFSAEYTAFRTDSYPDDGKHAPAEVRFVGDLNVDALRRDFTVNAIYYDLKKGEFIDPVCGISDCEQRILRTVRDPDEVFREDGLRLLRLARFAATYGLRIEEKTEASAVARRKGIEQIKPERIRVELDEILLADRAGRKGAQREGIELLDRLGLLELILPELSACKGVKQRADYHRYDVYGHILATLEASAPVLAVRRAALLHDIAKPVCLAETGRMAGHDVRGAEMCKKIAARLCYSNADATLLARLVRAHMFDLNADAREITVRRFVRDNADILPLLLELKRSDAVGSGRGVTDSESAVRLRSVALAMRREGVPFSAKELFVRGEDLIEAGISPEKRANAIKELLDYALETEKGRTKEGQLAFLAKFVARA